jgi:hypothetical protein
MGSDEHVCCARKTLIIMGEEVRHAGQPNA